MTKSKEDNKKRTNIVMSIILAVFLVIIILFSSLNAMIFNKDFYYSEYSKNDVYSKIPQSSAKNMTANVMDYFHGSSELKYFTDTEKNHMQDVKNLVMIMNYLYYLSVILLAAMFIYLYRKIKDDKVRFIKILTNALLYSSIFCLVLLLIVFLMCVFYFDLTFTLFHLIFFPQGNWMFASSSLLITLFPEQFFFDISLRIFIYAIFQTAIFLGIGLWIRKHLKTYEEYQAKR